jgi:riboflavin synthase
MFSGIVEEVGRVASWEPPRLTVRANKVMSDLKVSDSIAVNGTCLTVVARTKDAFTLELAPETLRRTNLGVLKTGDGVDLERALAVGDRLGGHIVQGHVDGTGKTVSLTPEGDCVLMRFSAPERLMPYIVEKGFIAVDGISLTVVSRDASSFVISVIPYTLANTVLKERRPGDPVNLEVDILAKYVESLLKGERPG